MAYSNVCGAVDLTPAAGKRSARSSLALTGHWKAGPRSGRSTLISSGNGRCREIPFAQANSREAASRKVVGAAVNLPEPAPGPIVTSARRTPRGRTIRTGDLQMTEFSFPCVSVSSSGDEYFQVCFQEADDSDEAYLLIQRQFEDDDGGYFYVECPHEPLGGHFRIRRAELGRDVLRLEFRSRTTETIRIRFVASDAKYKELKRILSIMIPADVFHVAV